MFVFGLESVAKDVGPTDSDLPGFTRLTFGVADNDRHGLLPGHQPGEANRVAESAGLADRVETRGAPCVGQRLSRGLRGDLGQEHSFEPGFYGRWAT